MIVTAYDVAAFLGPEMGTEGDAVREQADAHLPVVTAMVRAYVRGRGFSPDGEPFDDVAQVIVSSTARLVQNPRMLTEDTHALDDFSRTRRLAVFDGWTLPELAVLHRYRKRAL